MSVVSTSVTFLTSSEDQPVRAFATLRFVGDALDPDEISRLLAEKPTKAYRKGQKFSPGSQSPELIGKTGIWYLSTRNKVGSAELSDHLERLVALIFPFAEGDDRLRALRDIMKREDLQAHVTCFWRGPHGSTPPSIPSRVVHSFSRLPADIEKDFEAR